MDKQTTMFHRPAWLPAGALVALLLGVLVAGCMPPQLTEAEINARIAAAHGGGADAGTADAGADAPTCRSISECLWGCEDAACEKSCLAGGAAEVVAQAEALRLCTINCTQAWKQTGDALCQDPNSPACVNRCQLQTCSLELLTCVDTGARAQASCVDGHTCLGICVDEGKDAYACGEGCVTEMAEADVTRLLEMLTCSRNVDYTGLTKEQQSQAWVSSCGTTAAACYTQGQSGNQKCLGGMACLDACQKKTGDAAENCALECAVPMTPAAQGAFVGLLQCMTAQSAAGWGIIGACDWAETACAGYTPLGLRCEGMVKYFQSCRTGTPPNGTWGCLGRTLQKGRKNDASSFLALASCIATNCADQCSGQAKMACEQCVQQGPCASASKACKNL